jgi:hypothetical protein
MMFTGLGGQLALEERCQLGQGENEDEVEKELDRGHPLLVGGGPFDVAPCFSRQPFLLAHETGAPEPTHAVGNGRVDPTRTAFGSLAGNPGGRKLGIVGRMDNRHFERPAADREISTPHLADRMRRMRRGFVTR